MDKELEQLAKAYDEATSSLRGMSPDRATEELAALRRRFAECERAERGGFGFSVDAASAEGMKVTGEKLVLRERITALASADENYRRAREEAKSDVTKAQRELTQALSARHAGRVADVKERAVKTLAPIWKSLDALESERLKDNEAYGVAIKSPDELPLRSSLAALWLALGEECPQSPSQKRQQEALLAAKRQRVSA
jgi:hypothetical protein